MGGVHRSGWVDRRRPLSLSLSLSLLSPSLSEEDAGRCRVLVAGVIKCPKSIGRLSPSCLERQRDRAGSTLPEISAWLVIGPLEYYRLDTRTYGRRRPVSTPPGWLQKGPMTGLRDQGQPHLAMRMTGWNWRRATVQSVAGAACCAVVMRLDDVENRSKGLSRGPLPRTVPLGIYS